MTTIVCDVCGGRLAIDSQRRSAICINCGIHYSINDLREYKAFLESLDRYDLEQQKGEQTTLPEYEAARIVKTALHHCENGNFDHAKKLLGFALKLDGSCQDAYLGLLLVENKVTSEAELDRTPINGLEKSRFFKKAMAIGDINFKKRLSQHAEHAKEQYVIWQDQKTEKADASKEREAEMRNMQQRVNSLSKMRFRVLDWTPQKDCALVMSLEEIQYHSYDKEKSSGATWESCELRKWLNGDYYNGLPRLIRNHIVEVVNQNPGTLSTSGGPDTRDKVFLLSTEEAKQYFKDDGDRKIDYANEVDDDGKKTVSGWWLRSPGSDQKRAAYVSGTGSIEYIGGMSIGNSYTHYMYGDVHKIMMYTRPVFWLAIPSSESVQEEREYAKYEEERQIQQRIGRWIKVKEDKDGTDLYVAEAPVADMQYHFYKESTNWRNCSLRRWLNEDFYELLPQKWKERIVQKSVTTTGYTGYSNSVTSQDKVFILSKEEYEACSDTIKEQMEDSLTAPIWFRNPETGYYPNNDGAMAKDGRGRGAFSYAVDSKYLVRPAVWMKALPKEAEDDLLLEDKRRQDLWRWSLMIHENTESGTGLFLAKDLVAVMPYGEGNTQKSWSNSLIRKWLNGDFYETLPEEIKRRIVEVDSTTRGDKTVRDKVFLLTDDEVEKYLDSNGKRIAQYLGWNRGWWLRSRVDHYVSEGVFYNTDHYSASYVTAGGGISSVDRYEYGYSRSSKGGWATKQKFGVRPAIWLKLE